MIHNNESRISVIDYNDKIKLHPELKESIRSIEQQVPNHIAMFSKEKINQTFLQSTDLLLISIQAWRYLIETKPGWLTDVPSVIILKHR